MKKYLLLFSIFFGAVIDASAQNMQWAWARCVGNSESESFQLIATDSRNGIYALGQYNSSTISVGSFTFVNNGNQDLLLVKYDTSGNVLWAKSFGGSGEELANSIVTDHNGNILITGHFNNAIQFGAVSLVSLGANDIFIIKLNSAGDILWAKNFGGTSNDTGYGIACDPNNNIYASGLYSSSSINFGGTVLNDSGEVRGYYCKLDENGNSIWAKKVAGNRNFFLRDVKVNAATNKIIITGRMEPNARLNFTIPSVSNNIETSLSAAMIFGQVGFDGSYQSQGIVHNGNSEGGTCISSNGAVFYNGSYSDTGSDIYGFIKQSAGPEYTTSNTQPSTPVNTFFSDLAIDANETQLYSIGNNAGFTNFQNGYTVPSQGRMLIICKTNLNMQTTGLIYSVHNDGYSAVFWRVAIDTFSNTLYAAGNCFKLTPGVFHLGPILLNTFGQIDALICRVNLSSGGPILFNMNSDTSICPGDSVQIGNIAGATGGQPPYTYQWSPASGLSNPASPQTTASPTASTTYSLTITDVLLNTRNKQVVVTVSPQPVTPSITASGPLSFCEGGSVTLYSSAANGYLWSNGATTQSIAVTTAGNYSVVTSNSAGCSSAPSNMLTVTVNPLPPTPTITANGPLSFCEGGSVQLTSTAANGYLWSNGATTQSITVTAAGNYSVVTSNSAGCNSAVSTILPVTVNQNPPVPVITQSGNTLSSSAATGNQWYFNGTIINGATSQTYNYVTPGQYTVTVTDANGCSSSSLPHTGNFVNGSITILSNGEEFMHRIAPNPVNNQASINYQLQSAAAISIQIITINGSRAIQLLPPIRQAAGYYRVEINRQLAALTPGMYIVQYLVNGQTVTEKFIVNR